MKMNLICHENMDLKLKEKNRQDMEIGKEKDGVLIFK